MSLRFSVLGSGTSVPDPDRGPAGFLLEREGRAWLVDGGSGTLQRCAKAGVDPRQLHGGVYSHRHPDHCGDLVPLLFSMKVGPPPRDRDYPLFAGEGFVEFYRALQGIYGKWISPGTGSVCIRELSLSREERCDIGGVTLITQPANHSAGALHLRFEADGAAIVFSGDTGPSEALVSLARGADLLVCECGGSDEEPIEGHLCPRDIAEIAARARPREIWLTHYYPQVDPEAALAEVAAAGIPVRRACDGDRWDPTAI